MAQRKDISIQFIADKCGVSIATVSRVLNNDRHTGARVERDEGIPLRDTRRAGAGDQKNRYHH